MRQPPQGPRRGSERDHQRKGTQGEDKFLLLDAKLWDRGLGGCQPNLYTNPSLYKFRLPHSLD